MMELVDTHCHIHFPDYELDPELVIKDAKTDGVAHLICVGCTLQDSKLAVAFAMNHENVYASIGLHPHESSKYVNNHHALQQFRDLTKRYKGRKLVAIGETGLDYHYMHSSKQDQEKLLRFQIDMAQEHNLPLIIHIREAYKDFWCIFDKYNGLKGVVHSFSSDTQDLDQILSRGLYVGLNGIITFTSSQEQLKAVKKIPLEKILLETDAPFLTPVPFRGTICQPKHVRATAEFLSKLRGEPLEALASATMHNAQALLNLRGKT